MLLMEAIRNLAGEENKNDEEDVGSARNATWTQVDSLSVTVSDDDSLILVHFRIGVDSGSASAGEEAKGDARLKIDGDVVWFISETNHSATGDYSYEDFDLLFELDSGTYTFTIETSIDDDHSDADVYIDEYSVGVIDIADTTVSMDSETAGNSVNDEAEEDICTVALTVPATRATPAGDIKKYNVIIWAYGAGEEPQNDILDVGEADNDGNYSWELRVDDARVTPDVVYTDETYAGETPDEGCACRYSFLADPDDVYDIDWRVRNETGGAKDCTGYLIVVVSPWIAFDDSEIEPVELDFTPGSTLYVVTEPLHSNDTNQVIKLGKFRARSFGDSTDYYSTNSGTGVQEHNYTFDNIAVEGCLMYVSGNGCIVAHIGVDWK